MDKLNISLGIVSVSLLVLLGVQFLPEDTHYCESRNMTMDCERVSSTSRTCYPNLENTKGNKFCREGWVQIDIVDIPHHFPIKYRCDNVKCVEINSS